MDDVFIVGGYGEVGARIARHLLMAGHRVAVGGRNEARARSTAATLGCGHARIDVADPSTWQSAVADSKIIISAVDQRDESFPRWVIEQRRDYVDITASDGFFRLVEELHERAVDCSSAVVLSVGLAPGLTNLLVKRCVNLLDSADDARIGLLLGLGDVHGDAAIQWTLERLSALKGKRWSPFSSPSGPLRPRQSRSTSPINTS